jgi:hypothetical protein
MRSLKVHVPERYVAGWVDRHSWSSADVLSASFGNQARKERFEEAFHANPTGDWLIP